jgi:hypothetical protein
MALNSEELRYACDVAQKRHSALVDLVYNNDRMALGLMQLYIAIASAAISGAAAIWFGIGSISPPRFLCFVLLALGIPCLLGAMFCFAAMWPSKINLPGAEPDLWRWADKGDSETDGVSTLRLYLSRLDEGHQRNDEINKRADQWTRLAKWSGVLAPPLGFLALVFGMMCGR